MLSSGKKISPVSSPVNRDTPCFPAVFWQLSTFTADCLRHPIHPIQMVGIETIWELHTLTVINSWSWPSILICRCAHVLKVNPNLQMCNYAHVLALFSGWPRLDHGRPDPSYFVSRPTKNWNQLASVKQELWTTTARTYSLELSPSSKGVLSCSKSRNKM